MSRLFSHLGGYGVFVALCEALVILWTIYFLLREGRKLWRERHRYFCQVMMHANSTPKVLFEVADPSFDTNTEL